MKQAVIIILGFFGFIIVGLNIYLQPNDFNLCGKPSTSQQCKSADAIIAISGGDTTARTNHAVELYKDGWAPLIIFSGAAQDKTGPSNALTMRRMAIAAGVPSESILIEEYAETTKQNAVKTNELLEAHGIRDVILVTSGYHQRRASLEFHKRVDSSVINVRNSPTNDSDWDWYWWLTPRGWWLAIGEFVKIIAFYSGASS